jgi:glycolate oxidase FAD binding subunit
MAQTMSSLDDLRALLSPEIVGDRDGRLVASPRSTEEVAAIARYANAYRRPVEIVGAGTKRGWGNAVDAELLLETTRLSGVREHSWQDLTATVGAGTTWCAMQRVLAAHGQFVALDPLWPERATVGGVVATNDSGALRLRYGSLRDLIIGMTIVLADGTIAKSGGKVVKNVAGYDLHKLMTGAYGTLGVIAEVTFRLHPLPQYARTFTVRAEKARDVAPLIAAIRDSHLLTQALQVRRTIKDGTCLDVQLNAHPDARQDEVLGEMTAAAGCELHQAEEEVWSARERLEEESRIALKLTMAPADVAHFADVVSACGGDSVTQSHGIMTAALPCGVTDALLQGLRDEVEAKGGSVSLLGRYEGLSPFGATVAALPLMREIKRRFDLNRVLNPGRFVGGI